jgi:hypothetical protein
MARHIAIGLSAVALIIGAGLATQASAADPDFCRDYAHTAVDQVQAALDSRRCGYAIDRNPARWTPDRHAHFDWCRNAPRWQVERERDARREELDHCLNDDRRHDDRDRHDGDHHW